MNASPDFCMRLLTRLRGRVALKPDMKGIDMDAQLADYASELTAFAPADVETAVLGWSRKSKWWPTLRELLETIGEVRETRQATIAKPRSSLDDLNAALERLMAKLPSSIHVRLYALHDAAPHDRRRIINRLAEWSLAYPDHVRAEALAVVAKELEQVEGHA